jgi:hypothetical protein
VIPRIFSSDSQSNKADWHNDDQLETAEKLPRAKLQRREDFVLQAICDFASLREPHLEDFSEFSTHQSATQY